MVKKRRSRHKSEPVESTSTGDKILPGYLSEPEPEWKTGWDLPPVREPIVKPSTEVEKPLPTVPQKIEQATPTKQPPRRSSRQKIPSASPVSASKQAKLNQIKDDQTLCDNPVVQNKTPSASVRGRKVNFKPGNKPQTVSENDAKLDKPCTKKRSISACHDTGTKKLKESELEIKKDELIENVDNKASKKRAHSAPSKTKKVQPKVKSAKNKTDKLGPKVKQSKAKSESDKVGSKDKSIKSEVLDLKSKMLTSDLEKAQPKRKRKMKEDGTTKKPASQQGRKRKGAAGRMMKLVRSPLPSFDDDEDDVFKLDALQPEQTVDNIEKESAERKEDLCEEKNINPSKSSTSITESNGMAEAADMDDVELNSNQSSDDELPDVLSQDTKKIHEGDIVWVKMRTFPYWPAVVKRMYFNKHRATILFSGDLNKSNQKGKGVSLKAMRLYSCPEKEELIEAGFKNPRVAKEEFEEAIKKAEDYITKRGLGKAQGASFFTMKDYSHLNGDTTDSDSPTRPLSLPYTPSLRAGTPLRDNTPSSPLTPPFDSPCNGIMDSPNWKTGQPLGENGDQSFNMEEEDSSDVDEELLEKRDKLTKLQTRLIRYITRRQQQRVKEHLLRIFHGKEKSIRHKLFFSAGSEPHNKLKYMRGFGPLTDDDKQDELMKFLRKVYEENCMKESNDVVYTSYIADVWFPEVIIFALQRTQRICHKRAEEMFKTEERNAMEITGDDDIKLPSYLTEEEKRELLDNVPLRAARQLGFSPRELGLS